MNKKSLLYLENGEVFQGLSFGYEGETTGEVVFNTSMTGYQLSLIHISEPTRPY